mgnify:CR=1 FL=1
MGISIPGRWWRYRRVHSAFGLKFWAVRRRRGAAAAGPRRVLAAHRASPLFRATVSLKPRRSSRSNHPFKTSKGSVGTPIEGVEVRIADDGEILVRGENVTSGYYENPNAQVPKPKSQDDRVFDAEGWFHTGDIGERDEQGRMFIKGRKKEMIVTPEGLNVFPEDVERVLNELPGVRDSAVVGRRGCRRGARARSPGARARWRARRIVRDANRQLPGSSADSRRVGLDDRRFATHRRHSQAETGGDSRLGPVRASKPVAATSGATRWNRSSRRFAHGRDVSGATTLEELGLSSLERVELMIALEDRFQTRLDEGRFSEAAASPI